MREFAFSRPHSAEAALASGARPDARYLGGGTNLVDLMKLGVETPALIVDLSSIDWNGIDLGPDGFRVGATVRNTDLAVDPRVRSRLPLLSQAVLAGASPQVRNMATVAGNLLQHTRCRYYMDVTKACNRRVPSSGCPARTGDHRNLAILGASEECIATHPSDLAVALAALDANVTVLRTDRTRKVIGLLDLFDAVSGEPLLAHGDLVEEIHVPLLPPGTRMAYRKVRDRASFAFAIASVAATLRVADGIIADVRLAYGAVAPRPWRARVAEAQLIGRPATEEWFRAAAAAELAAADPLPGNAYKIPLMENLTARVLAELS